MNEPTVLSSLPSRPLSVQEASALEDAETDQHWIRPESVLMDGDTEIVVALGVINRERGQLTLVGYEPEAEGWTVIGEWTTDDIEHDPYYEALDEWEAETFG